MNKTTVFAIAFLAFAVTVPAKPKSRTFRQPCSTVFPTAENLARVKPYKLQLDGKADMNLIVETGSFWKAGASQIIVQFSSNPDGTCTVTDNSAYSGVRRNGTVFLDRLETALVEAPAAQAAQKP